jgi:hypothetical protein
MRKNKVINCQRRLLDTNSSIIEKCLFPCDTGRTYDQFDVFFESCQTVKGMLIQLTELYKSIIVLTKDTITFVENLVL